MRQSEPATDRPAAHFGMHHLALRVTDVAAIRHFYVDLLGFSVERETPKTELWLCHGADSLVFLAGPRNDVIDHLGVMVADGDEVGRWEAYLRLAEVPILEPTEAYDDGSVGMICQDPAGIHVQMLWHPRACANLSTTARP